MQRVSLKHKLLESRPVPAYMRSMVLMAKSFIIRNPKTLPSKQLPNLKTTTRLETVPPFDINLVQIPTSQEGGEYLLALLVFSPNKIAVNGFIYRNREFGLIHNGLLLSVDNDKLTDAHATESETGKLLEKWPLDEDATQLSRNIQVIIGMFSVSLALFDVIQAHNTELVEHLPDAKLNKKRARYNKHLLEPYYTVRLQRSKRYAAREHDADAPKRESPRSHSRRSHIRTLHKGTPQEYTRVIPATVVNPNCQNAGDTDYVF